MQLEEHFQVHTGEQLFCRSWTVDQPQGSVVVIHGHGEHCGRYDALATRLNGQDLNVFSYDQRGHGRSPGKRGHIGRFQLLVDDLKSFLQHLAPRLHPWPQFLLGHSLGGLVLANFVVQFPQSFAGLIFSSPLLRLNEDVSPVLIRLSRLLSTFTPWLPVARVNPELLSRDEGVVGNYRADPFVYHGKINARTGAEIKSGIDTAQQQLSSIHEPIYILHGGQDRLVTPAGSRDLHEKSGSTEKVLQIYEGGFHELFHDLEREEVIAALEAWLRERLHHSRIMDIR